MSEDDPNGWGERYDIHDYTIQFLEEHRSEEDEREDVFALQQQAAINYVVGREDIKNYEYHYITAIRIAWNIKQSSAEYKQAAGDFASEEPPEDVSDEKILELADSLGRFVIGNNVALTYSMAYELLDDLMRELLPEILKEEMREDGGATLQSQVGSYQGRYQLLRVCGVLDDDVAKIIDHVGDVRSDLSHDVERRFDLGTHDDLEILNELPIAINTLYEQVYGQSVYQIADSYKEQM